MDDPRNNAGNNERIPEERQEPYTQLIALLHHGLREPAGVTPLEQSRIIARVQERLLQGGARTAQAEEPPDDQRPFQTSQASQASQTRSQRILSTPSRRRRLARTARDLAAILVIGILVGATLLLFRSAVRPSGVQPPNASTGPTAVSQVDGMQASIHIVTPGPYFLRELISVDLGLTNQTSQPLALSGGNKPDSACDSSALSAQITAGSAPTYTLPRLAIDCALPLFKTTVAPGQTLTLHSFLPVTKSGEVTITMGGMRDVPPQASPLDGRWPSVSFHVDPQIPTNRALSLRNEGAQVIVHAPSMAQALLLYWESITCDGYGGGGARLDWSPLPTLVLSQPACPTAHRHWEYLVSAPGYAIAAGARDS